MLSFRGFSSSDFAAFNKKKWRLRRFNEERKAVYHKLKNLREDLDALLRRRGVELEGSVSHYWIVSRRREESRCLWLRYPAPKGKHYDIPHLEVVVWRDEVFVGLSIPERGTRYQARLIDYVDKQGMAIVKRISRLPSHAADFIIQGKEDVFSGKPKDITMREILLLTQSHELGKAWIVVGYSFRPSDRRLRKPQLVGLVAKIFSDLYWLYRIAARGWRPTKPRKKTRQVFRPYQMKRSEKYSDTMRTYDIDLVKKEKSSKAHIRITNLLATILRMQGCECQEVPRSIDLVYTIDDGPSYLFEVKSCNENNIARQIRMGISQLYEYRYFVLGTKSATRLFLVTQRKPSDSLCKYLEDDRNIGVIWLDKRSLNATRKTERWLSPIRLG